MSNFNRRSFLKTTCISVGALYASASAAPLVADKSGKAGINPNFHRAM